MPLPPILDNKHPDAPSVFDPGVLLREARRQKGLAPIDVRRFLLDPDWRHLRHLFGTVERESCR